jgi:NitT/TauT family transport system substrate-binding protein
MFATGAAASALAFAAGCSSSPKAGGSKPLEKVTYLTGFGSTPRDEYAQIAVSKGYFSAAGIEVTVQPGQPSDANMKALASGKAQFASLDFVSAVRGAATFSDSSGHPSYRIVAAIQQRTLLSMITIAGTGVSRPADLAGKTLGAAANAATQTLFPTYARLANIDASRIKFVNVASDQLPIMLVSGQVAAVGAYSVDVPTVRAAAQGREPIALPYSSYLPDLYGTVVIAQSGLVNSSPDLVKRFAAAIVKGTQYAVAHPEEAAQIIKNAVATTSLESATETMKLMAPYVGAGDLDPARVMRGISVLQSAGLAPAGLRPQTLVATDLTPKAA